MRKAILIVVAIAVLVILLLCVLISISHNNSSTYTDDARHESQHSRATSVESDESGSISLDTVMSMPDSSYFEPVPNYVGEPLTETITAMQEQLEAQRKQIEELKASAIDSMVMGRIAYKIPDTMALGKSYAATASITKAKTDSILLSSLQDTSKIVTADIKVSSKVKVSLLDMSGRNMFNITPLNTHEQGVDSVSSTMWSWMIEPTKAGEAELRLLATVTIKDKNGEKSKDVIVFNRFIRVQSSYKFIVIDFVKDYWQWLLSAFVLPFLVWMFSRFQSKKKKQNNSTIVTGFKITKQKDTV